MSNRYFQPEHPHADLLSTAVRALKDCRPRVLKSLIHGSGLGHPTYSAADGTSKQVLAVDQTAENECTDFLVDHIGDKKVRVLGEETLWKFPALDLSKHHLDGYGENVRLLHGPEERLVVIIDMIDGSDLVERNLGNWCSAMVFFKPCSHPKILFSMVHNADGTIYGADEHSTFLIRRAIREDEHLEKLKGPEVRKLRREHDDKELPEETRQIGIFFYAQNDKHFTTIPPGLPAWIKRSAAAKRIRTYNLAGNPIMARLANGENIHAVFEHLGQFPHDAVPGAYIGVKAGACLVDFKGNEISVNALAASLMKPSGARLQYVLACTEEVASELAGALRESTRVFYKCDVGCTAGIVASRDSHPPPVCDVCGRQMLEHERRGVLVVV